MWNMSTRVSSKPSRPHKTHYFGPLLGHTRDAHRNASSRLDWFTAGCNSRRAEIYGDHLPPGGATHQNKQRHVRVARPGKRPQLNLINAEKLKSRPKVCLATRLGHASVVETGCDQEQLSAPGTSLGVCRTHEQSALRPTRPFVHDRAQLFARPEWVSLA